MPTQYEPVFFDIETTGLNPMIPPWWDNKPQARVIAIGYGTTPGWRMASDFEEIDETVNVLYDEDEYRLLDVFSERLEHLRQDMEELDRKPFVVGWNIRQFDMPYMGARYARKRLNGDLILHRMKRLDMMKDVPSVELLSDHANGPKTFPSQDEYAEYQGFTVEDEIDGSEMPEAFEHRRWNKIDSHCRADVEMLMKLFTNEKVPMIQGFYDHYEIDREANFPDDVEF